MPSLPLFGRRDAIAASLSAFAVATFVREARGATRAGRVAAWIDGQQDIAESLARGRISGLAWAQEVERLAREVDVAELMAALRSARVVPAGRGSHNDPFKRNIRFLAPDGTPRRLTYGAALFDFSPDNVITPHGHRHMVSAHLVVAGRLRVRNFDRIADEDGAMLIRPTRDYRAGVGAASTMCGERDNIHWFVPVGGPATTFDVVVSGLDPGAPDHLIQAIDPVRAERRGDGTLRAPIIGFAEASRLYTAGI
jgi:hypothetical protein